LRVNKTSLKAAMKTKLKYPSSHDKVWTKINEELEVILPSIFPDKIIKSSTPLIYPKNSISGSTNFFLKSLERLKKQGF